MIVFRHCDSRFAFLASSTAQAPARWHGPGDGPVSYFADTPVGAWAEFLRHEGITDPADLAGVERSLWAVEIPDGGYEKPVLEDTVLRGGTESYPACQSEAKRLRALNTARIEAPSAALVSGGACGWVVDPVVNRSSTPREGRVFIIFGPQPTIVGWPAVEAGSPPERTLPLVHHL